MIRLRRANTRTLSKGTAQEAWLNFFPQDDEGALRDGFGPLQTWKEGRFAPRMAARHPRRDSEIITYVREGALSFEDSTGRSGQLCAGEFQRMTAGRGVHYSEANVSPTEWVHAFQIWLRPAAIELEPGHEQRRFSAAERRGVLCLVASPDARKGSLLVHQDAFLYSALLGAGQHIIHALGRGRGAWLHVVQGEVQLGEAILHLGDGAAITAEEVVSLTASKNAEILLLDLGDVKAELPADEGRK